MKFLECLSHHLRAYLRGSSDDILFALATPYPVPYLVKKQANLQSTNASHHRA